MAINVNNNDDSILYGLVAAYNALRDRVQDVDSDGYSAAWHRDLTTETTGDFRGPFTNTTVQDASPSATDLASSIVKANSIKGVLELHLADDSAHFIVDSVNKALLDGYSFLSSSALIADVKSLANGMKAIFNAHRTQSGVHLNDDTLNVVTLEDATDQTSANALLNDIGARLNLHIANAPPVPRLRIRI